MSLKKEITQAIKSEALALGFSACGIAPARHLQEAELNYSQWLQEGRHGKMQYMERNFDKRLDPRLLSENIRSIIVLLHPYYPPKLLNANGPIISKYAYGEDYHFVLKDKMRVLAEKINRLSPNIGMRVFTDSAPVAEKQWAQLAGLGSQGKNTNLITRNGSFFFISEIILETELEYDEATNKDYCGRCTRCIDACPTGALFEPYKIDARKCISYLTIENKGEIPEEFKGKFKNRVFGCDICQDVCPYNKKPVITNEARFFASEELLQMQPNDWHKLDRLKFNKLFKKSPVKRSKYEGFMRNLKFILRVEN